MVKMQKQMEKNQNTSDIEKAIVGFRQSKQTFINNANE